MNKYIDLCKCKAVPKHTANIIDGNKITLRMRLCTDCINNKAKEGLTVCL